MRQFGRISHDANIMGGKACIAGTRVTVGMLLMQISEGTTLDDLITEYPFLTKADIAEAIKYAAWAVGTKEEMIIPA